jgi:hypothetical protein
MPTIEPRQAHGKKNPTPSQALLKLLFLLAVESEQRNLNHAQIRYTTQKDLTYTLWEIDSCELD